MVTNNKIQLKHNNHLHVEHRENEKKKVVSFFIVLEVLGIKCEDKLQSARNHFGYNIVGIKKMKQNYIELSVQGRKNI